MSSRVSTLGERVRADIHLWDFKSELACPVAGGADGLQRRRRGVKKNAAGEIPPQKGVQQQIRDKKLICPAPQP
jgi:hypothetical protein